MYIAKQHNQYVAANVANKSNRYFCPSCHGPVILKKGDMMLPHFAHVANQSCDSLSENETTEHLTGKLALARYFTKKYPVQIEPVLTSISQRPDILVTTTNKQVAVEFQCSPITQKRLNERNAGYTQLGIKPIWVLGRPYLNKQLSAKTIIKFMTDNQLYFYDTTQHRLFNRTNFTHPDFKRLSFGKKATAVPPQQQRLKLQQQAMRKQIHPSFINQLYQRKLVVNQIGDVFLLGTAFGLATTNWQFRLSLWWQLQEKRSFQFQDALHLAQPFYLKQLPRIYQKSAVQDFLLNLMQMGYLKYQNDTYHVAKI